MGYWDWLSFRSKTSSNHSGLLLSGGGARSSFQLGALTYLYDKERLNPKVIVGTSAGSILAAMIAQYADPQKQRETIAKITKLWFDLNSQSDMFIERNWFRTLREQAPEWLEMLTPAPNGTAKTKSQNWLSRQDDSQNIEELTDDLIDPIELALSPDQEFSNSWSPSQLLQLLTKVGKIGKAGGDLNAIWRGAERTRSCYCPGPLLKKLLDPALFSPEKITKSGISLRLTTVALESGELRFMREDGVLVDQRDNPINNNKHDVTLGVFASCAIPAVFLPVRIDNETYIDGGARASVPAEYTIEQLDTRPTYVIPSSPIKMNHTSSMAKADIISVVVRATNILMTEPFQKSISFANSTGAIVITPEIDVHGPMEVDPGLIRINWDYGWIRAAESLNPELAAQESQHKKIIQLRIDAHKLEQTFIDPDMSTQNKLELAKIKYQLRDEINDTNPEGLPKMASEWWRNYEAHFPRITAKPSWLNLN